MRTSWQKAPARDHEQRHWASDGNATLRTNTLFRLLYLMNVDYWISGYAAAEAVVAYKNSSFCSPPSKAPLREISECYHLAVDHLVQGSKIIIRSRSTQPMFIHYGLTQAPNNTPHHYVFLSPVLFSF